jgi:hypothetical protein
MTDPTEQWIAEAKTTEQLIAAAAAEYRRGRDCILNAAHKLVDARAVCNRGEWEQTIARDWPFGIRMAQLLTRIGEDPRITANAKHVSCLAVRTLSELTKLDDETFNAALASGKINPMMTQRDAKRIVKSAVTPDEATRANAARAAARSNGMEKLREETADARRRYVDSAKFSCTTPADWAAEIDIVGDALRKAEKEQHGGEPKEQMMPAH